MTPSALLASLRAAGFTLHLDAGRVMVAPAPKLTPDQRAAIARNRDALAALLDHPSEDAVEAMCERAYFDPPDWSKGTAQVRESVILRMEGFPTVAMDPKAFESIRMHNDSRGRRSDHENLQRAQRGCRRPILSYPVGHVSGRVAQA